VIQVVKVILELVILAQRGIQEHMEIQDHKVTLELKETLV
jgi:hypothetical protein